MATTKSPANGDPPADDRADSTSQLSGSFGIVPCAMIRSRRSTSIDSPRRPPIPSTLRRTLMTRTNRQTRSRIAIAAMVRAVCSGCSRPAVATITITNVTNQTSVRGRSTRAPTRSGTLSAVKGNRSGMRATPATIPAASATSVSATMCSAVTQPEGAPSHDVLARERNAGWQRLHQNRLRAPSTVVLTARPQTWHG